MFKKVMSLLILTTVQAYAHGDADWINKGRYRNAVGDLCCGEQDCIQLPDTAVTPRTGGYTFRVWSIGKQEWIKEIVPYSEAQPSPDGHYWYCQWGGQRKCFFAPPMNF